MPDLEEQAKKYVGKIGIDKGPVHITRFKVTSKGGSPAKLGQSMRHTDLRPELGGKGDQRKPEYGPIKKGG